MNIYELHAGSWKHKPNSTQSDGSDGWYDYEELARIRSETKSEISNDVQTVEKRPPNRMRSPFQYVKGDNPIRVYHLQRFFQR